MGAALYEEEYEKQDVRPVKTEETQIILEEQETETKDFSVIQWVRNLFSFT